MRKMKRIGTLLLCTALLLTLLPVTTVHAEPYQPYVIPADFTGMTLEDVVGDFMETYGLQNYTFAISYYNTVTGESYAWNDDWFSIAASTYKLPLNMYFYEMQQAGEISGDTIISWTGQTLDYIHEQSIVNSNNEFSEALMYYWNDHTVYKQNLRKYFTMTDEEIHPSYWQANWFCVRMMMDCLKYLYENQDNFEELIGYMKQAMPGQYFKHGVMEYEVAHKYGAVQTYHNDVGIIYTPQPFLLAVYTQGMGEYICAEAARLLTAYTVWQGEQNPVEPELPEEPVEEQEPEVRENANEMVLEEVELPSAEPEAPEPVQPPVQEVTVQEVPQPVQEPESRFPVPVIAAGAAGVVLLVVGIRMVRKKSE